MATQKHITRITDTWANALSQMADSQTVILTDGGREHIWRNTAWYFPAVSKVWNGVSYTYQDSQFDDLTVSQLMVDSDVEYSLNSATRIRFSTDTITLTDDGSDSVVITGASVGISKTPSLANLDINGDLAIGNVADDGDISTTVLVDDGTGLIKSNEIDSRVWGTSLLAGSGTTSTVPLFTPDGSTLGDSVITQDGGNIGIGVTTPLRTLDLAGDATSVYLYRAVDGLYGSNLVSNKSRGTTTVPTVIVTGDDLFTILAQGYDGTGFVSSAKMIFDTEGTVGTNRVAGNISFWTHPDSTSAMEERMRIDSAGALTIASLAGTGSAVPLVSSTGLFSRSVITRAGSLVSVGADLLLQAGSQSYTFSGVGDLLSLTGNSAGSDATQKLYSSDNDGTDSVAYQVSNNGNVISIGYSAVSSAMELASTSTGTVLPIDIYTTGNANQIRVAINGNTGFGVSDPDHLVEIFGTANQFKISYDATHYATATVDVAGETSLYSSDILTLGASTTANLIQMLNGLVLINQDHTAVDTHISTSNGTIFKVDNSSDTVQIGTAGSNYSGFGRDGTLVFNGTATVWDDINFSIGQLRSGGTRPAFISKRGSPIYQDSFAVGEEVSGSVEIPHATKLSSAVTPHIHITSDAGDTTGNCRFEMTITVNLYDGSEWFGSGTVTDTGDIAIASAWQKLTADFTSTVNNLASVGAQIEITIERIAAVSDEWAGEIFVSTFGFHVEKDMVGSRLITTK